MNGAHGPSGAGRRHAARRGPGRARGGHPAALLGAGLALALALSACQAGAPEPEETPPTLGTAPAVPPENGGTADPGTTSPPAGEESPDAPADAAPVELGISVVAEGLVAPWDVAFAPDGTAYVSERDRGVISRIGPDGRREEVATVPVDPAGEGGLLGLAFGPGARLYAYYTSATDNRIVRFPPGLPPGSPPESVLTGIPKARIHDGGRIAFGPDGMLYAGTGDAAEPALAQEPGSLAGKVLRLTPDGEVPADNPIEGSLVYSLGHRNVQGLAWTADGTLYASELGPDADDEINRIVPGGNYGWPLVTGRAGREDLIDPVFVRQPPEASWSGLAALRDGAIPQWEGDLFAAGLRGNRLWRLVLGAGGEVVEHEELLVGEYGRLRAVRQAPDGSLWVLTNNRDGRGNPGPSDDRILRLGP